MCMNTRPWCRPIHVLYNIVFYETHKTKTFRNLQLSEELQVGIHHTGGKSAPRKNQLIN